MKFLLGANYWSRAGGPRMWERFDEAVVRSELASARAIGLDCLRAFAFIPSFMPAPPAVDGEMLARLRRFLLLCEENRVGVFPTALVGHMSGENFDFPGGTRALFTDEKLIAWQRALVSALAECESKSVLGWVLSNEMPLWAEAAPPAAVEKWCRALVEAIRARSALPIGAGDGMMGGWPTRLLAPQLDWIGPHVYYGDVDPLRQALATDFAVRAAQAAGKPVLVEEMGCSSAQAGEIEQARFYREAIFAALGCGASGFLAWCFSDFDAATLGSEAPYVHHAWELGFGLTRADGGEKPVCGEFRAARAFLDGIALAGLEPERPRAALLVSDWIDEEVPFSWDDRGALKKALLQSYVLGAQAGLDLDVIAERDDFSYYKLILVPSTQKLKTPTWRRLAEHARAGATLYWSYYSGDNSFHQGMWCPNFRELTGLVHRLRYGCFDLPGERMSLRGAVALDLPTGISRSAEPWRLSRLPIERAEGAPVEVLAADAEGRAALVRHELGAGDVIFLAYPIERYLAALADGSTRDAHRLYRTLAKLAEIEPRYPTRHADVHSRLLRDGADDLVIVQHRAWSSSVDDATEVPREAEIVFERDGIGSALGPKGVRVYRVKGVR